ncbi:MAG: amidase [Candidatus Sulfotelmatobacter sp.]
MSLPHELAFLDATAQAELVRRKQLKPVELVDAAIARIERLNPALNAVITPMFELARAAAHGPLPDGPFRGVPFLLKDLLASYAGVRMASGSSFLKEFVPEHDSELVVRLKRAGLVIVGKTNTPELGILPTTEPSLFGPSRNPWVSGRITGGSSGGSAAAVATGMVPMAHANDGGGSIRIPASCCGLFGMKPTRGRNPLGPDFGDIMNGLVAEHAVTRSVRDSAGLLDATAGPDTGDPYCAPPPARPFLQEVGADPGKLRIAFTTTAPSGVPIHADCVCAVHEAANLCSDLGHSVNEAAPTVDAERLVNSFTAIWSVGCAEIIEGAAFLTGRKPAPDQFEELTWVLAQQGHAISGPAYLLAVNALQGIARQVARFFANYDIWLTPTLAEPPLPLGSFDARPGNPLYGLQRAVAFVPFTPVCNATGQPAMSVPLFWNAEGLPVGTHFVGRFGEEATLFRLAAQLETARPWAARCPATSSPQ